MSHLLSSSCRMAFAALIHDIGKLAQRAKLPVPMETLDAHKTLYCPYNQEKKYHSHVHAAYTGIALDQIEPYAPNFISQHTYPFIARQQESTDITDSLINAAASHHKPDTLLQWIIATADRIASGFEREKFEEYNRAEDKNFYQSRLLSLFENIQLNQKKAEKYDYAYPLSSLSTESIFPKKKVEIEPNNNEKAQQEYSQLWNAFLEGLKTIPKSHQQNWDLWLDHFDTAYQCFTACVPSATAFGVKAEVSLYDHSKTTAALATALWRWTEENKDKVQADYFTNHQKSWGEKSFLLIQGDFFGIQDFIFSGGSATNKNAAKLLRGRSFQVSLFTELAALKLLQACELPSISQIMNAAGKFLIVAPNTPTIKSAIAKVQQELNQWAIENTFGLIGVGIATTEACANDFMENQFSQLQTNLFRQLEKIKLQRLDLIEQTQSVQEVSYPYGVCRLNSQFPACSEYDEKVENSGLSIISKDQIEIGKLLAKNDRLIICDPDSEIYRDRQTHRLAMNIFGYSVVFTNTQEDTGKFGQLVDKIYRFWDFELPEIDKPIWQGYARRYINAYVPLFSQADADQAYLDKYKNTEESVEIGKIKTFDFIACEDRHLTDNKEKFIGQRALMTLKGDVDNLGLIFQKGLEKSSFAKMASLSRQMNQFFSLWLPAYCQKYNPDMYTVFAGGDDFFLIGSWKKTQALAYAMQQKFAEYVAFNPDIHFSAGMGMTKVGSPVPQLGEMAEKALEKAKDHQGKNAVTLYQKTISWNQWQPLVEKLGDEIERLAKDYSISTAYLYALIYFSQQASDTKNIEATMWRSRFYYKTARYVVDKLKKEQRDFALKEISTAFGQGIEKYQANFAIPLFNYFYQKR
ncbi:MULTISPECIES: type III-A CRISPR-associated protein Cas10/Csm1 [Rodentibacter]|uniref:type III-A CRISPR-associated protein Cas10/Csm1 n=1 Tax=Rodentibacter TaxID=1960084 RepID=UPI001CFD7A89|nr:type III-A CRISPR-associated protein Cas10/Csm1 [Rodentibacter sp. JRC1]GJI56756.1 type III-A CRISPR-associated protein Cas10/Csm1 [Rodentibacter sp. JRC1]